MPLGTAPGPWEDWTPGQGSTLLMAWVSDRPVLEATASRAVGPATWRRRQCQGSAPEFTHAALGWVSRALWPRPHLRSAGIRLKVSLARLPGWGHSGNEEL